MIRPNLHIYMLPAEAVTERLRDALRREVRGYGAGGVRLLEKLSRESTATKNIITTAGLNAWAYNLVNSDGQVIDRLAVGTGTTAPALGDTALATQTAIYTDIELYAIRESVIVIHWLAAGIRDDRAGETIAETGLFTTNSGATESSNKLVARAVLDSVIPVAGTMYVVFVWNLTVVHTTSATQIMTDFGKNWMCTRLTNLSTYNPLNRIAFGTGTTQINPRESEALATEAGRLSPTTAWARTGTNGQVEAQEPLAVGEIGGQLEEIGPAIDATTSEKTVMQDLGVSIDNDTSSGTATSRITLSNA